jgi:hypothetical protein
MGEKTVEVSQKLRYTLEHAVEFGQRHEGGEVAPLVAQLERERLVATRYEERWAFLAHGGRMDSTAEFVEFRRDWYGWTKGIRALTAAVQLNPYALKELLSPPPLTDTYADGLCTRVAEQLQLLPRIDDGVEASLVALSQELCTTEADWGVVSAAMLAGYWLRRVESESGRQIEASPDTVTGLLRIAAAEPDGAVLLGAISVWDAAPGFFSGSSCAWSQLRTWAIRNARDRHATRRRLAIEPDVEPSVREDTCGRAFTVGYAACFVEQAIARTAPH